MHDDEDDGWPELGRTNHNNTKNIRNANNNQHNTACESSMTGSCIFTNTKKARESNSGRGTDKGRRRRKGGDRRDTWELAGRWASAQ